MCGLTVVCACVRACVCGVCVCVRARVCVCVVTYICKGVQHGGWLIHLCM